MVLVGKAYRWSHQRSHCVLCCFAINDHYIITERVHFGEEKKTAQSIIALTTFTINDSMIKQETQNFFYIYSYYGMVHSFIVIINLWNYSSRAIFIFFYLFWINKSQTEFDILSIELWAHVYGDYFHWNGIERFLFLPGKCSFIR